MPYLDDKNLSPERRAMYQTLSILENSAARQTVKEAEKKAFVENEKLQAELQAESEKHRLQREAELRIEAENFRKQSAANFETDLRQRFFEGNPFASESDFQKILPKLRENAMLSNVDSADKTEQLIRESGSYSRM